jgi:uncharacterized protein YjiS (DUF1127 family)
MTILNLGYFAPTLAGDRSGSGPLQAGYRILRRAARRLAAARARMRSRRELRRLSTMDDHILRDIGVTRVEVLYEAEKPLWLDLPPGRFGRPWPGA